MLEDEFVLADDFYLKVAELLKASIKETLRALLLLLSLLSR